MLTLDAPISCFASISLLLHLGPEALPKVHRLQPLSREKGTTSKVLTAFTLKTKRPGTNSGPGFAIPC